MITSFKVNGLELTSEYNLDVASFYLGDIETEYIEIKLIQTTASLPVKKDGIWVNEMVDISQVIKILDLEENLKLVLRDRMESIE